MNHIHTVDLFYVDAVHGGTLGHAAFDPEEPYPDPADLSGPVHIHRPSRIQTENLADILMHVFLRDQHHRGQVHAMLSGTSVKPPQLEEFFMADDARFRMDDLAAVGWDEPTLMR